MLVAYNAGHSLEQVGKAFGCSRQGVFKMFKLRGWELRDRPKPLPFVVFNGTRYTRKPSGYYAATRGGRGLLHRAIWEASNGPIPSSSDIHHRNGDRGDNRLANLELMSKSDHARHHHRLRAGK